MGLCGHISERGNMRNLEMAALANEGSKALRQRTVQAKRGKGRKNRPNNNRTKKEFGI